MSKKGYNFLPLPQSFNLINNLLTHNYLDETKNS